MNRLTTCVGIEVPSNRPGNDFESIEVAVGVARADDELSITDVSANIWAVWDEPYRQIEIGSFSGQIVGVFDSDAPELDCDAHSAGLEEMYSTLFDFETREYKPDPDVMADTVLYLDQITIKPEYRGRGAGLLALSEIIRTLEFGVSLVVLKPFPLQFCGNEGVARDATSMADPESHHPATDEKAALLALKRYYRKLGFRNIKGTPFMQLDWRAFRKLSLGRPEHRVEATAH